MKELPVDKSFKKWRTILLVDLFFGYCLYYITRKSCTYSVPLLLEDKSLPMTKEVIGLMASSQMLFYSMGRFICGILSDQYSSKLMFSVGLLLAGITNILFAFCSSSYHFIFLWAVNGFFQGCGWAPIAILIKRWYLPTEIGTIWSVMSATMNVSSSIIPILMITLSDLFNWRISFIFLGTLSCIFSFISFTLIKDNPSDVTCKSSDPQNVTCESSSGPGIDCKDTQNKGEVTPGGYLDILSSKFMCLVSFSYLLWTGVKSGIEDWLLVYLISEKSLSAYEASFSMMYFQFGGLFASLTSGIISDILMTKFKDKMKSSPRLPVVIFWSTFILCWLYLLQSRLVVAYTFINITCFIIGACCYGPHTLFGLLVIENSPPGLSGTAHGIAATASTIGSVFAGYPLSSLSDKYGWSVMFSVLAFVALLNSTILLLCTRLSCKIGSEKKKD